MTKTKNNDIPETRELIYNHQLNIRLDDDINERLTQLSIRTKKGKSELMRDAFKMELEKVVDELDTKKEIEYIDRSLSDEERANVLKDIAKVKEEIGILNKEMSSIGNNYNQIAKKFNEGSVGLRFKNERDVDLIEHNYTDEIESLTKKVDELWRIFI